MARREGKVEVERSREGSERCKEKFRKGSGRAGMGWRDGSGGRNKVGQDGRGEWKNLGGDAMDGGSISRVRVRCRRGCHEEF